MATDDLASQVLALVSSSSYLPLTLKRIAKQLKVGDDAYADLRAAIKAMIRDGTLELRGDKTLVRPQTKGTIVGTFRRSSKGFGFVRPSGGTGSKSDQIFIPPDASKDASTGDEVAVKIVKKSRGQGYNAEGRIVQVLARASGLFVGTYFERAGAGMVKIDGTAFNDPIYVGDPGAKGARTGDKVALEMVRYPTPFREGEGVITEVLGPRGRPGVDTLSVIRALNIPDAFDDDVLIDAREQAKLFDENVVEDRLDLRDRLTVTIDPATARDFDDAITLTRDDRGFWHLGVHIADVTHFVREGSALDKSARTRGTSVYLPDRVIPMLPEILSNSLASLQAGQTRYTVSAFIEFDPDGRRTDRDFARTAIRVDHRFAYEQVMWCIDHPDEPMEGVGPELRTMLVEMLELAMILRKRRFERGALELEMPEVEVDLGEQGEVVGAHLASHDRSHQVIEEFMLAANEAVASFLTAKQTPFLRRAHPDPELHKLQQFSEFARGLGFEIENPDSRFQLQKVLDEARDRPEAYAVHFGLLRSLKQATYTPDEIGHYALASDDYCHFTSPIRRYPDLHVHRRLLAVLAGKRPKGNIDELAVLADHCTKTERRAETAEREIIKIKLLTFLQSKIGEIFHAVIIAVEDFGFFARIIELPIEGLVHVGALEADYYYLESETHTLIGRRSGRTYRLGDELLVRVVRVDIDRRELELAIPRDESETAAEPGLPPSRTRPKTPPRPPKKVGPTKASSKKGPKRKEERKQKKKKKK
ncbi:MAG: ribonuclease R [Isosphaeraceae bacterium]|nr:ribonuclease R [Isosphaeraceae bacterium]